MGPSTKMFRTTQTLKETSRANCGDDLALKRGRFVVGLMVHISVGDCFLVYLNLFCFLVFERCFLGKICISLNKAQLAIRVLSALLWRTRHRELLRFNFILQGVLYHFHYNILVFNYDYA